VLSDEAISVETIFFPIASSIDYVFDMTFSGVYWPDGGITPDVPGALKMLEPGYAYLIRLKQTATIDFGNTDKVSGTNASPLQVLTPENWNLVAKTGKQHIISVKTAELQSGDIIGAFNAENLCVGITQFDGNSDMIPMVIAGDDETTEAIDGMTEGDMITFKLYQNGIEEVLDPVFDQNFIHSGKYQSNGLSVIQGFKAGTTGIFDTENSIFSIYPNPNNGEFTISMNVDGNFDVEIINMNGQKIMAGSFSGQSTIDMNEQPKGVYFVRISNTTSTSIHKVIIE